MPLGDWRDVSIILLAIEAIVIGLVYGLIFYYLWKGFRIATGWLRLTGLPQGRRYSRLIKEVTNQYSKKIVRPVVNLESKLNQTSRTLSSVANTPKQRTRR
jgi:hypothetical protein